MDWQFGGSNPFTYFVGEHARAVVAIQDLQREVTTLLSFRDNVLDALPHLKIRATPATTHEGATGETTAPLAPTSTVVDSGFSTDKASTSMGKSSSSSSGGELSGSARWGSADADARLGATYPEEDLVEDSSPLGSAEDELWQLLEVIQRKGSRLRNELQRAEMQERELGNHSAPDSREKPPLNDCWPHSLPPPAPGPRFDSYSLEAFGEVERLRWDRSYLLSRVSRAEAEAAVSHSRLVDLHSQLVGLATEKRRLEEAFLAYGPDGVKSEAGMGYSPHTGTSKVHIDGTHPSRVGRPRSNSSVTVNVSNDSTNLHPRNMAWREEEVTLPRVLKVPIRDKGNDRISPRTKDNPNMTHLMESRDVSTSRSAHIDSSTNTTRHHHSDQTSSQGTTSRPNVSDQPLRPPNHNPDRVVIERQRTCNKVDGGLSMPASIFKGSKIKVTPDKQRISAILREKDVLALQRQLLTTVMETEVLRRQMECCNEEWTVKNIQFEQDQRNNMESIVTLTEENKILKNKLESLQNVPKCDVGIMVRPFTKSIAVATDDPENDPTFTVHEGPNVKYDVVVHQEAPRSARGIEKPPRKRSQPPRMGLAGVDAAINTKESLCSPRGARSSPKPPFSAPNKATPSNTPRSSPASSLTSRNSRPSYTSVTSSRRDSMVRTGAVSSPTQATPIRGPTPHKIPVVNSINRVNKIIPSLSSDSLSPTYTRLKRRAPLSPSSIESKSEMIESPSDSVAPLKEQKQLNTSHFIRNTYSVSKNRYLPKAPNHMGPQHTKFGSAQIPDKYFPIDKANYGATSSYLPVSVTQRYLLSKGSYVPPPVRYYNKIDELTRAFEGRDYMPRPARLRYLPVNPKVCLDENLERSEKIDESAIGSAAMCKNPTDERRLKSTGWVGDELDRSDSSADEHNAIKSTEVPQKALWRKSSGAVRLRTVGRPSVLSLVNTEM